MKALFDDFEKAEKTSARERIVNQAVTALKVHAILEEAVARTATTATPNSLFLPKAFAITSEKEENDILPKAKELDIDFEALGQRILEGKKQLQEGGIPSDAGSF